MPPYPEPSIKDEAVPTALAEIFRFKVETLEIPA